jgi:hypothetical protein
MIAPPPAFAPGESVRIEKMGIMRKKIADHMVMSIPHITACVLGVRGRFRQDRSAAPEEES